MPTAPTRPLACLRAQDNAPLGILAEVLDERGVDWHYVDLWRGNPLPSPDEVSGLVVLGGSMNVDQVDEHPWLGPVRGLTAEAVETGVPVLGVCLGAQILARAGGAPVHHEAVRAIGFSEVRVVTDDPLLEPFAPSSPVLSFHSDVCELPDGAELLAVGDNVRVQAFRLGEAAYGVQFHFEVTAEILADWCDETSAEQFEAEWGTTKQRVLADAARHLARQQNAGRAMTGAFADLVAARG